eukprot:GHVT01002681.1.p2 GENE.GHVT01002681.1~~GHVT01002681.1.p2  ORF type:complete len:171 (+),score=41.52 GHVT01002681.1:785-1297(+)
MLMTKILTGQPDEVPILTSGKHGLKYVGLPSMVCLTAISRAHKARSLEQLETTLVEHSAVLARDPTLAHHISSLRETMVEENLQRILEPYSRVEISHVAKLIKLPLSVVQQKLAEMILDGKLQGTLDQGVGVLVLFEHVPLASVYTDALATIKEMAEVVDTLAQKAQMAV